MRLRCLFFILAVVPVFVVACSRGGESEISGSQASPQGTPEQQLMQRGLNSLYGAGDALAAESTFREVLSRNPAHYGAQYQLAVALDRGGKPAEARPVWEEVLRLAEGVKDENTASTARSRLAAPDSVSVVTLMSVGLNFLRQGNPSAAAEQFRKVLERNPDHYGANYQLAVALDRLGRRAEARPYWQRILTIAETFKDQPAATTARERLRQNP